MLYFINNAMVPKVLQEITGIVPGKLALLDIFQIGIIVLRKSMPYESRFAALPGAGDNDHRHLFCSVLNFLTQ
jgi:hypothetical protein